MIFDYISYFANATGESANELKGGNKTEDKTYSRPYYDYDQRLIEFMDELAESEYVDYNYVSTIEKYGLTMSDRLVSEIDTANEELLKAILTCYMRQERFCDGIWKEAVENKIFLKALIRLQEFDNK